MKKNDLDQTMDTKDYWIELLMTFFVSTTFICILEGVVGSIFYKNEQLGFGAFFSPPIFGLLSVVFGIVSKVSFKTKMGEKQNGITTREVMIRRAIHLLLIEMAVFILNWISGHVFSVFLSIVTAISVGVIYVLVYCILFLYDRKSAEQFNQLLKVFQEQKRERVNP